MSARRSPARAVVASIIVVATLSAGWATADVGGAAGDGGASSHVTRDGRIITSILLGRPTGTGRGGPGPSTYWLTLSDADVGFLVHVAAAHPELVDAPLFVAIEPFLAGGTSGDIDVQVLVRDGRLTAEVRSVPAPPGAARALARRMVTELPPLPPTITPPASVAVPVREPVFVSFTPEAWATVVDRSLTAGGVTARVRARPVAVRLSSGDPAQVGRVERCNGPGRPYQPGDPAAPAAQARRPDACSVTYATPTGVLGRRDRWYGDYTVIWRAEWTTDGVTWRSLGDIARVTLFARQVRALSTSIESDH